jgi:uncharacterized protein (TIGR02001 family)
MKYVLAGASALAMFAAASGQVLAADLSYNLGVVSDYVFRGASQTDGSAAVQGGVDLSLSKFYVGTWASNVDFGEGTDAEIDLYAGYLTEVAGYALDLGVGSYFYVGAPNGSDYQYQEFKAVVSREVGAATLGAAVYHSFDYFGADKAATYVEANAAWTLSNTWTVSGAVGYQAFDVSADYTTWNLGASYTLTDNLALDLRYHDLDSPHAESRFAMSLKATF